ncbi:Tubulin-folding cofactor B [Chionoecetes opilio]|uniref:Tubulin-folding cofactor B n=1 Tax=Chionoecetes opilio TaxID=41210 RepID=A0A8J4Y2J1_CHIOP|nr:Tubulin-folding cofactor B [Chionoecetes opilio]
MQRDVRQLEREAGQLDEAAAGAKKLRNKSHYLGTELEVTDTTRKLGEFEDLSQVEKYELPEEEYNKRGDSVRSFLQKNRLGKYNAEELKQKQQEKEQQEQEEETKAKTITVGRRCEVSCVCGEVETGVEPDAQVLVPRDPGEGCVQDVERGVSHPKVMALDFATFSFKPSSLRLVVMSVNRFWARAWAGNSSRSAREEVFEPYEESAAYSLADQKRKDHWAVGEFKGFLEIEEDHCGTFRTGRA